MPFRDRPLCFADFGELHEVAIIVVLVVSGDLLGELLRHSHHRVTAFHESGMELCSGLVMNLLPGFVLLLH